ncbi:MAG TPA: response regulator [Thermoleophilia bacterium]|nr:response regulator [Thermoleophilia bacterium]
MAPIILVAEDNPDIQSLVMHALEADGYGVCLASDGQQALDLYRSLTPDLLILDIMMPSLTGFEVLRRLADGGELCKDIPVLVLTSRSAEDDIVAGFDLGVDDYLTKPFMIRELRARVRALLARAGKAVP